MPEEHDKRLQLEELGAAESPDDHRQHADDEEIAADDDDRQRRSEAPPMKDGRQFRAIPSGRRRASETGNRSAARRTQSPHSEMSGAENRMAWLLT